MANRSRVIALSVNDRRCCTARSKLLTSLCRWQSHPAQYVSGIPSAVTLLSISHPIRCSTRCLANVRVRISGRRCCTARSKLLTSLCRWQSHPAQYVSGIPSAVILLSISHPIRCSTRCLANVRVRISGPMIAL